MDTDTVRREEKTEKESSASKKGSGRRVVSFAPLPKRASGGFKILEPGDYVDDEILQQAQSSTPTGTGPERGVVSGGDGKPTKDRSKSRSKRKPLSADQLAEFNKRARRRGIIFLSRIPHTMQVAELRRIMSSFGTVERVYLTPANKRAQRGGEQGAIAAAAVSRRQRFVNGWIEFSDKRVAKRVAATLNNQAVGGSRRARYREELWNLRYLPGVTWDALTEQIAFEKSSKQKRITAELSQARREAAFFQEQLEKARVNQFVQNRLEKREQQKRKTKTGKRDGVVNKTPGDEGGDDGASAAAAAAAAAATAASAATGKKRKMDHQSHTPNTSSSDQSGGKKRRKSQSSRMNEASVDQPLDDDVLSLLLQ